MAPRWMDRTWNPEGRPEHMALLPLLQEMEAGQVLLRLLDDKLISVADLESQDRPRSFEESAIAQAEWRGYHRACLDIMAWLTPTLAEDEPRPNSEEFENG